MQLVALGKPAAVVPVEYQRVKMTLYKGEDALAARREVASKLTHRMLKALQRKRNVDDKPDWAPMQMLFDADLSYDPFSGMPVFDPSACAPALLKALWRGFCGVADTINTKQMGQTDEALDELQMRLHEHAAQLRETAPRARRLARSDGTLAKRSRTASPVPSLSDEGTDAGEPARERKLRPRRTIPESDDEDEPMPMGPVVGSDDAASDELWHRRHRAKDAGGEAGQRGIPWWRDLHGFHAYVLTCSLPTYLPTYLPNIHTYILLARLRLRHHTGHSAWVS